MYEDDIVILQKASAALEQLARRISPLVNKGTSFRLVDRLAGFYQLQQAYSELDTARKLVGAQIDVYAKSVLPSAITDLGTDKIAVPAISRSFYILTKSSASILDKTKAYPWLKDNGGADLITETVNASTLAAFVGSMIKEKNIEPPNDAIKYTTYNLIGSSAYTSK